VHAHTVISTTTIFSLLFSLVDVWRLGKIMVEKEDVLRGIGKM
jgi:hypothetical protein